MAVSRQIAELKKIVSGMKPDPANRPTEIYLVPMSRDDNGGLISGERVLLWAKEPKKPESR